MNKLALLTSIAGLACALSAQATLTTGTLQIQDSIGNSPGGSFNIQVLSGLTALDSTVFRTFCIERDEYLQAPSSPNWAGPYNAAINPNGEAVMGGQGGPEPDPISWGTAWLYSQFRKGTLSDAVGTWSNTGNGNTALQSALWYLEEEDSSLSNSSIATLRDQLLSAAAAAYPVAGTTAAQLINIPANGAFGVRVLNLTDGPADNSFGRNQDILAIVPEPSTYIAGGLALLPLLFGLRARFQRK
jgi:hypothetical protein